MKKVYILTILLSIGLFSSAQVGKDSGSTTIKETVPGDEEKIFTRTEVEANFPGGDDGWRHYLMENLDANVPVKKKAPAGTYMVVIRFIVSKTGEISDVQAETKHGYGMEEEAIRVIKNGPKWTPAYQNKRVVNAYRRQSINFVIKEK